MSLSNRPLSCRDVVAVVFVAALSVWSGAVGHAQNPRPYAAEEVVFDNPAAPGVRLAGTLTIPGGTGPFPAVVLISGAGPHDRDETNAGHKPFAALADYLSSRGIAVLRTDDRGVGASTGSLQGASWLDLATDARAGVAFLRARRDIDPAAVGILGHSQGGIIAPIATAGNEAVAFMVSLAGPSTDFITLTLAQRRRLALGQGAPEEVVVRTEAVLRDVFTAMAGAETLDEARAAVDSALTPDALARLGAPQTAREAVMAQLTSEELFVSLHNSPQRVLPRVRVPVLALTGSLDAVVDADANLSAIATALADNPDVTTVKLEGLNHFFQTAITGAPDEYASLDEDFAPSALETIAHWIDARFAAP